MSDASAAPAEETPVDEEPPYFEYSATLRIFGAITDIDEITRTLGVPPSHTHRRGERRLPISRPYEHDMWSYVAPVPRDRPLHVHIDTLWAHLQPHRDYLLALKSRLTVDVFCGYRSNSGTAGLEVPHASLALFTSLEVPFGLSIIVA